MSVLVYPRLSELLREKNITTSELARDIKERLGLRVSLRTLERLTHTTPIRHADLELAGAVASVLNVELNDIFVVEATPVAADVEDKADDVLDPDQSRRMRELYDRQESVRSRTMSGRNSMASSPRTGIVCMSGACAR